MGNALGLDIGYSNVIAVFGSGDGHPESITRPSLAAPLSVLPGHSGLRAGEVIVEVDGAPSVALAAPRRVQDGRELLEDYTSSHAYEALFKAALLHGAGDIDVIDCLVTGLPVSQPRDKGYVEALVQRMTGTHRNTPKREVTDKRVELVAQPIRTLTENYCNSDASEDIEESVSISIDPGFISVDWVVFDQRELVVNSCSSTLKAMSVVLEACYEEIANDHGGNPGVEQIEHALHSGKSYILIYGRKVQLAEYLVRAAERDIPSVITENKQGLRFLKARAIVCVILGGGRASLYEPIARKEIPDALVVMPVNSVKSNAEGYWHNARS
ncbi:ParM/StbA family protein [Pseudomonas aeruginosa]|uniref:ParM/StbA family protein n=1 Tax=Pseudomonas aeruginosa TaxID=287 RepID=UPI001E34CDA3|nr:ParM/StbA family protein [Pseudomonas aeruginosa]MCC9289576.1 ParM/StbA family protein [Pseudomonas aeruginosa]UVN18825.1 Partitioning protein ParM [Pseudomonas aeruginosa]